MVGRVRPTELPKESCGLDPRDQSTPGVHVALATVVFQSAGAYGVSVVPVHEGPDGRSPYLTTHNPTGDEGSGPHPRDPQVCGSTPKVGREGHPRRGPPSTTSLGE